MEPAGACAGPGVTGDLGTPETYCSQSDRAGGPPAGLRQRMPPSAASTVPAAPVFPVLPCIPSPAGIPGCYPSAQMVVRLISLPSSSSRPGTS